jgi:hypothetical protein
MLSLLVIGLGGDGTRRPPGATGRGDESDDRWRPDTIPPDARGVAMTADGAAGEGRGASAAGGASRRVLDPVSRASEVLFGLIMVMTFTLSLGASEAGRDDARDAHRRARLQPRLGDHRRGHVPDGHKRRAPAGGGHGPLDP